MKNIKYTLLAVPENPDDLEHSRVRFKIFGEYNNVDWAEGPRRERITNDIMEQLVKSLEENSKLLPDNRRIFFGFNKEFPKIHRKIMEYNLVMSSDPKKGSRIKRGEFQRFNFDKMYNKGVCLLDTFVDGHVMMAQTANNVAMKYGKDALDKVENLITESATNPELRAKLPLNKNGSYDRDKLVKMALSR